VGVIVVAEASKGSKGELKERKVVLARLRYQSAKFWMGFLQPTKLTQVANEKQIMTLEEKKQETKHVQEFLQNHNRPFGKPKTYAVVIQRVEAKLKQAKKEAGLTAKAEQEKERQVTSLNKQLKKLVSDQSILRETLLKKTKQAAANQVEAKKDIAALRKRFEAEGKNKNPAPTQSVTPTQFVSDDTTALLIAEAKLKAQIKLQAEATEALEALRAAHETKIDAERKAAEKELERKRTAIESVRAVHEKIRDDERKAAEEKNEATRTAYQKRNDDTTFLMQKMMFHQIAVLNQQQQLRTATEYYGPPGTPHWKKPRLRIVKKKHVLCTGFSYCISYEFVRYDLRISCHISYKTS
jgi:hypothetical protein